MLAFCSSCTTGPEPIRYGQDNCHHCQMTLMDKRFGAEIVTDKGKVYKFDDLNCLVNFMKAGAVPETSMAQILAVDFQTRLVRGRATGVFSAK